MSPRREVYAPIGVVLVHSVIAFTHGGPVAVPDVVAYLRYAQLPFGEVSEFGSQYFPLYGLLLSPFGGLSGADVHTVALLANGFVSGLLLWVAVRLAAELRFSRPVVIAIGTLAVVMPTMAVSSRIAWPEALLTLLITCSFRYLYRSRPADLVKAGVCVGFALGLHPRASVLVVALLVAAVFGRCVRQVLKGLVPALILVAFLVALTGSWPKRRLDSAGEMQMNSDWLISAGGQLLGVTGATCGLALIGLLRALMTFRKFKERDAGDIAAQFLGLSAVLMVFLGGWVLTNGAKADALLYSRYLAPWCLALTIFGLLSLREKRSSAGTFLAGSAITLSAMAMIIGSASSNEEPIRVIMTLSLTTFWKVFDQSLVPTVIAVSLISLCCLMVFRTHKKIRYQAPLALCLCLAISSSLINNAHLAEVGRIADGQSSAVRDLPESTACINIHVASTKPYAKALYSLYLPATKITPFDLDDGKPDCEKYVIAGPIFLEKCESAKLLRMEERGNWGLWKFEQSECF